MGDSFERIGYNQLNHKLKITRGGFEVTNGNISGSSASTGSFGSAYIVDKVGIGTTSPDSQLHVVGDIRSTGDIIAENYIISSSVTYMTQSFSSGSTVFGNSADDTHTFTGSLKVSSSVAKKSYIIGGNVGINHTAPNRTFSVSTNLAKTSTTTAYPFSISSNETSGMAQL